MKLDFAIEKSSNWDHFRFKGNKKAEYDEAALF